LFLASKVGSQSRLGGSFSNEGDDSLSLGGGAVRRKAADMTASAFLEKKSFFS